MAAPDPGGGALDPGAPGRRPMIRVLAGAWLVLVAVVLLALGGELWLRLQRREAIAASERFRATNVFFANGMELNAGNHSLWQERWQEYLPGAKLDVVVGGERFVVEMNSEGYRTQEFARPKPAGLLRIICIGGSTTVAGRTNDETYPALLQAKLRARYPGLPLEVLNLGVSSATTDYWYARLPRVFGYEPDIVVQYPGVNDISWRALPHFANANPGRGRYYQSLLVQKLFPFPVEELDPYLEETFTTLGDTDRACRARGVACLVGSFAGPDPEKTRGELRKHLDFNAEFWFRRFPLHSYATWARVVARYNELFVRFVNRYHVPHALVHQRLSDPSVFIDVCHLTPEGIDRLAEAFLPEVAELVEQTEAFERWKGTQGGGARR
jgi:lysophospholipase L1-like esterase